MRIQILLPTISLLFSNSYQWWNTGHLVVARIAYDYIVERDQTVMDRAEGILSGISMYTTLEKNHPFVEAATFPDYIKEYGWSDQSLWHYVDTPFFDQGYTTDVDTEA